MVREDYNVRKEYVRKIFADVDVELTESQLEELAGAVAEEVLPGDRERKNYSMTPREIKEFWDSARKISAEVDDWPEWKKR